MPGVPWGDVLRGDGSAGSERKLQRWVLLQRGLCGGERELVRRSCSVQRVELRCLRGRVSRGVVLSSGVGRADGVWGRGVLRDGGAVAGERALRRGVLLQGVWGLECEAGREGVGVRGLSGWVLLSGGDCGACAVPEGDVLRDCGEQERVGLPGVCCRSLLP